MEHAVSTPFQQALDVIEQFSADDQEALRTGWNNKDKSPTYLLNKVG